MLEVVLQDQSRRPFDELVGKARSQIFCLLFVVCCLLFGWIGTAALQL